MPLGRVTEGKSERFAMHYPENNAHAKAYALKALTLMDGHKIVPNPTNYTIWYAYASGARPDLNGAIDEVLARDKEFTDEHARDLFRRYFTFESENDELKETGERIETAVNQVLEYFSSAQTDATQFGETLAGVSEELAKPHDSEEVGDLVRVIMSETQQMVMKSADLEKQIATSAKEMAELREHLTEVRREAMTDPLTGLANRKCFDSRLAAGAEGAQENETKLSLLIADIDHFKQFNDQFGHPVGDKVLRIVARSLREGLKGRDTSARYGGEEFAIILPQTRLKDAAIVADQIRQGLAARKIVNRQTDEDYGTVTLSIGVAEYRYGEPLTDLIRRADDALYRAKRSGRNRVETESADVESIAS